MQTESTAGTPVDNDPMKGQAMSDIEPETMHDPEASEVETEAINEAFSAEWVEIKPRGLIVTRTPTFEEWEAFGLPLARLRDELPFIVGDWMNIGEATFAEKYSQSIDIFGEYAQQTVSNYKSVMGRVPFWHPDSPGEVQLRSDELSYKHHEIVAPFHEDPDKQMNLLRDAEYWPPLGRPMTSSEFARHVKGKPLDPPDPTFGDYVEKAIDGAETALEHAPSDKAKDHIEDAITSLRRAFGTTTSDELQETFEGAFAEDEAEEVPA